jgi:hypothetical protein
MTNVGRVGLVGSHGGLRSGWGGCLEYSVEEA